MLIVSCSKIFSCYVSLVAKKSLKATTGNASIGKNPIYNFGEVAFKIFETKKSFDTRRSLYMGIKHDFRASRKTGSFLLPKNQSNERSNQEWKRILQSG